jgi:hypothetical protein
VRSRLQWLGTAESVGVKIVLLRVVQSLVLEHDVLDVVAVEIVDCLAWSFHWWHEVLWSCLVFSRSAFILVPIV